MRYTFEITIAGCATDCVHCYVDGGPAPIMPAGDFAFCLQKLKPVLERLDGQIHVTLGNELFCHPQIKEILTYTHRCVPDFFSYCEYEVPTTGIALVNRQDKEQILSVLRKTGADRFMLALHGTEADHNRLVKNAKAYGELFRAADWISENGFGVLFNLMVSRSLFDGFDAVMERISRVKGAEVRLTVPLYLPTERMRNYEQNRADADVCRKLAERADRYGIATDTLRSCCENSSRDAVLTALSKNEFDYNEEIKRMPNWAFFHVAQDLELYYGNVGMHTRRIGNLRSITEEALTETIRSFGANYDYTAFFDERVFRSLPDFSAFRSQGENLVYASRADCLYRLLDLSGVENCLL